MRSHASDVAPEYRFTRILPDESKRQLDDDVLLQLAAVMSVGGNSSSSDVPSGYTYLGQFIAHDLSFSEGRPPLGEIINRRNLEQGRSPSLDLDTLYGGGPDDPTSEPAYQYDKVHLRVASTSAGDGLDAFEDHDLPRGDDRKALVPDPRNDQNVAVAQTHVAMIHFHNRVVDRLGGAGTPEERLGAARDLVTKHYQWMIKTDYLPRVCAQAVIDDVFENGRKAFDVGAVRGKSLTMPLEFAVAAFRFGHAMIRRGYSWNSVFDDGMLSIDLLFGYSASGGDLGGAPQLPSCAVADFRRLYEFEELGVTPLQFNHAMRIDTALAGPLGAMPASAIEEKCMPEGDPRANLAFRDLRRAKDLSLATGQEMARFLRDDCEVDVTELEPSAILAGDHGARLDALCSDAQAAVAADTPLWFYVLREAECSGGRLAGVGAQIVVEVLHRAMQGSLASLVREPDWRPTLGPDPDTFRMVDLLRFAFEGKKERLAPLEMS